MGHPGSTGARQPAGRRGRSSRLRRLGLVGLGAAVVGLLGCRGGGGGAVATTTLVPDVTAVEPTTSPPSEPGSSTTSTGSSIPTTSGPGAPSSIPKPPARLELGGDDLGVTRVGAPFREAVSAVAAVLGPPAGDPAPDSACIGAQEEASWPGFRMGRSGAKVSGWLSTSPTLATPAGAKVGTTVNALRQAYGARLQVRPAPEPGDPATFAVDGAALGGALTGSAPTDTVTRLHNGTCEAT